MSKSRHERVLIVDENVLGGRDFTIGGLYNDPTILQKLFDERTLGPLDRVFIVGDVIGKSGKSLVEGLTLHDEITRQPPEFKKCIYMTRGNHEDRCLKAIEGLVYLAKVCKRPPSEMKEAINMMLAAPDLKDRQALANEFFSGSQVLQAVNDIYEHATQDSDWMIKLFFKELQNKNIQVGEAKGNDERALRYNESRIDWLRQRFAALPIAIVKTGSNPFVTMTQVDVPRSGQQEFVKVNENALPTSFTLAMSDENNPLRRGQQAILAVTGNGWLGSEPCPPSKGRNAVCLTDPTWILEPSTGKTYATVAESKQDEIPVPEESGLIALRALRAQLSNRAAEHVKGQIERGLFLQMDADASSFHLLASREANLRESKRPGRAESPTITPGRGSPQDQRAASQGQRSPSSRPSTPNSPKFLTTLWSYVMTSGRPSSPASPAPVQRGLLSPGRSLPPIVPDPRLTPIREDPKEDGAQAQPQSQTGKPNAGSSTPPKSP